jgi:hypothetical protein
MTPFRNAPTNRIIARIKAMMNGGGGSTIARGAPSAELATTMPIATMAGIKIEMRRNCLLWIV